MRERTKIYVTERYMGHRAKPLVIYCWGIWVISTRSHIQSLFPLFPALKPIWPLVTTNYSLTMSPFLLRSWTSLFLCVCPQRMNDKFLKILLHGSKKQQESDFLRKNSAKFVGCVHDKYHINLPWKSLFLVFLCGLRHKSLCCRHKVNINQGKQHKLMWYFLWRIPKNFPCF